MADPITFTLDDSQLRKVGLKIIEIIDRRTGQGIDADGNPFAPYSEKPFAMPLGGITARARTALGEKLHEFTTSQGALWAVIEGGYKAFKAAAFPQDSGSVNLTQTGRMLSGLTVVGTDPSTNTVSIGFTNSEDALKAWYHNKAGAGKSKTIRKFMGLTEAEEAEVATFAAVNVRIKT